GGGGGPPPPATPPRPVRRFTRAADALARGPLPIPRSLRAQLATVLAPLGEGARALADALAVALGAGAASAEAPLGPLAEVAGVDGAAALAELVRVGLVRVVHRPGAEEAEGPLVEFVQPRTRDLLYAAIPAPARARLHRRTGESLERRYRRRMPLVVDALAEHFSAAGVAGKAYPYLVRAGARMLERSFVAEAERFFQRALAVEPEARELLVLEDADRLLCETLLRRAEALDHLGRWGDTAPDLARAAALAAELADDRLGSRVHAALGQRARQAHDVEEATTAFSRALALAERAGATELRVPALHGQGAIRWALGDLEGARRAWAETLQVGEATGDLRALALAQNGLGLVALCRGQSAEARKCFEQSAELFERLGLVAPLATARLNLVEIHHFTGNLRRGVELAERTLAHARETGHTLGIARARHHRALLLVDLGRFLEGREEAREALAAVRRLGQREDELATLVGRLRADWALGDLAEVRAGLIEADGLLERYDPEGFAPIVLAWRARVAWRDGDPTSARAALERALAWTGTAWPYQECRFELALGRVFAAFGDRAEATRRAEAAIRRADASGFRLYALKGHQVVAACGLDEAQVARHRRVADALARSLAANLGREDAQRFLELAFAPDALAAGAF
ncbi:MAG: hypothetical protein RLZZ299_1790, partial [Pseudomonadota bacterium]